MFSSKKIVTSYPHQRSSSYAISLLAWFSFCNSARDFIPRCIAAILGGIVFGGDAWWYFFTPLSCIGLVIDIINFVSQE